MDLRVAFEWSHRVLAGSVTLGFAALAAIAWRRTRAGDPVRRRLALAAALLAVQILLGALTVWQLLAVVDGHGASRWSATRSPRRSRGPRSSCARAAHGRRRARRAATPGQRRALAAVLALLAFQLVLGGLVSSRYAGLACPEWPTCNGGLWFPSWRGPVGLHLLHRTNGYLLLVALAGARVDLPRRVRGSRAGRAPPRRSRAAQVAVGIANVLAGIPVELTGLHSALAAALVLTATGAAHAAWARVR